MFDGMDSDWAYLENWQNVIFVIIMNEPQEP